MTIKKMFLFPAAAMVLLLAAFFVGLGAAGADKADVAIYIVIALSCLMPFCLHVISLVGSLRKNASTQISYTNHASVLSLIILIDPLIGLFSIISNLLIESLLKFFIVYRSQYCTFDTLYFILSIIIPP